MKLLEARASVEVLRDGEGLEQHLSEWRRLAAGALEPNPFYEPALLLPALRLLRGDARVEVVLVFRTPPGDPGRRLIGLFPLERLARYRGVPLACDQLWKHLHGFLCTPLVSADHAPECLAALFDWLRTPAGAPLIELGFCAGDGPWARALDAFLCRSRLRAALVDSFSRACYRPATDLKSYLAAALPRQKRKEIQRLGRRLAECGRMEYAELSPEEDPRSWIEAFLELEASGWKGRDGTALALSAQQRGFFEEAATSLAAEGRLWMLGLALDGKWIALKCNFLTGRGGFAFKIAYDEKFAQFSPGLLLEFETLARLHARREIEWMDSCAASDHFMANRLWTSRREITTRLIATGPAAGRLFVRALPLLQRVRRSLAAPASARQSDPEAAGT